MVKVTNFLDQALLLNDFFELLPLDSRGWEKPAGSINVFSIVIYTVNLIY